MITWTETFAIIGVHFCLEHGIDLKRLSFKWNQCADAGVTFNALMLWKDTFLFD